MRQDAGEGRRSRVGRVVGLGERATDGVDELVDDAFDAGLQAHEAAEGVCCLGAHRAAGGVREGLLERALQLWVKGADEERHALHHRVQGREDRHFDGGRVAVAAQADERADHGRDEGLEGVGRRLFDEVGETQGALLALLGGALEQAVQEHRHERRRAAGLAQAGEGR